MSVYWKFLSEEEIEEFEERSAIMEFDGKLNKSIAETRAFKYILSQRDNDAFINSKKR
jgi:hypothetical protein